MPLLNHFWVVLPTCFRGRINITKASRWIGSKTLIPVLSFCLFWFLLLFFFFAFLLFVLFCLFGFWFFWVCGVFWFFVFCFLPDPWQVPAGLASVTPGLTLCSRRYVGPDGRGRITFMFCHQTHSSCLNIWKNLELPQDRKSHRFMSYLKVSWCNFEWISSAVKTFWQHPSAPLDFWSLGRDGRSNFRRSDLSFLPRLLIRPAPS